MFLITMFLLKTYYLFRRTGMLTVSTVLKKMNTTEHTFRPLLTNTRKGIYAQSNFQFIKAKKKELGSKPLQIYQRKLTNLKLPLLKLPIGKANLHTLEKNVKNVKLNSTELSKNINA